MQQRYVVLKSRVWYIYIMVLKYTEFSPNLVIIQNMKLSTKKFFQISSLYLIKCLQQVSFSAFIRNTLFISVQNLQQNILGIAASTYLKKKKLHACSIFFVWKIKYLKGAFTQFYQRCVNDVNVIVHNL